MTDPVRKVWRIHGTIGDHVIGQTHWDIIADRVQDAIAWVEQWDVVSIFKIELLSPRAVDTTAPKGTEP